MIFVFLAFTLTGLYCVVRLIGPEFLKPLPPKAIKVAKPSQKASVVSQSISQSIVEENRIEKLESLLAEKNKNIALLQKELYSFHAQVRDLDKVKNLLEEEIQRLREQNRIFRSELGMLTSQTKEN